MNKWSCHFALICTATLSSCDDGTGNGLILTLFLMFWLSAIPTAILFWIFGVYKPKKTNDFPMTPFVIVSVVVGLIIRGLLFR
jgi:hypothetical protein